MNSKFIGDGAPIKNVELRSPDVPCNDPEQMIRAIDLELQSYAACRGKRIPRRTHRSYGIVGIILMITAALIALQVLISHMHTLSGRLNESENYQAARP